MSGFGFENLKIRYGIQTIFSTLPFQNNDNKNADDERINRTRFEEEIEGVYFQEFRETLPKDTPEILYNPLKYYMLGDYDVVYISLINNFKFSHRLFEPILKNGNDCNTHTFQNYSGFILNQSESKIKEVFDSHKSEPISYFIGIINLKLNNGLFIGNGLKLIEKIYNWVEDKIKNDEENKNHIKHHILTQSFSWFELSLTIFTDNPNSLSKILQQIRALRLVDLIKDEGDNNLLEDSLYKELFWEKSDIDTIKETSVFADTVSHFGFNEQLVQKSLKDNDIVEFMKKAKGMDLKTEIEWQIKPGHIPNLMNLITEHEYLKDYFPKFDNLNQSEANIVLGKCDYYLTETNSSILSNFHLIRHVARSNDLFKHIRKVRTYIYFDKLDGKLLQNKKQIERKKFLDWDIALKKLAVKSGDFFLYDEKLKKLKVSRHIRNKILKIFSNYNNGILDPIQFTYFIDMSILIEKLKLYILNEAALNDTETKPITEITNKLLVFIKAFQEAYDVRFLNGYQFESISDFDLDYNNSIQQLLSCYGVFVHEYGKLFYKDNLYAPVIQLNDLDTVSDIHSINYAIHHFTSPEFIFTTLAKEVLNSSLQENEFSEIKRKYKDIILSLKEEINESYFDDLIESETFDLSYFIIDCIRFHITFKGNFDLYKYWIWSYNFQNTSLYDTDGMFNESHLKTEMLRLLMLQKYIRYKELVLQKFVQNENIPEIDPLICPIPHLDAYWFLHFEKLNFITDLIFKCFKENKNIFLIYEYIDDKIAYFNSTKKNESSLSIIEKCLKFHFEHNKGKVAIVNRDWKNGDFCPNNYNKGVLYAVDQIGTQYFYTNKATQEYFQFNAEIILSIIDYATQNKKKLFKPNEVN